MASILIVDDHPIVRQGIRSMLEAELHNHHCREANDRRETLNALEEELPDVAIIDLLLRHDDGLALVKEINSRFRSSSDDRPQILMLTMQDESIYAERVLRAGANGFLAKDQAVSDLAVAVETVLGGEIYLNRALSARILGRLLKGKESSPGKTPILRKLSDRELHVFQLIGAGVGTKDAANSLGLSPKTIETYRENIKAKLNLANVGALKSAATRWVETGTVSAQNDDEP